MPHLASPFLLPIDLPPAYLMRRAWYNHDPLRRPFEYADMIQDTAKTSETFVTLNVESRPFKAPAIICLVSQYMRMQPSNTLRHRSGRIISNRS